MRRVWRGNCLRSKVSADAQIRGIFSLFDCLMPHPRVARGFLLRANVIVQFSVAHFEFAPRPRDIFFYRRKFRFSGVQLLLGHAHCVRATQARPDKFRALFRKTRSPRANVGRERFQVWRGRIQRMQVGELFQQFAIGGFALLNPAFYAGKLALAYIHVIVCLVALLKKRLLLRFQLCNCRRVFARNLLPFFFDPFYSFLDPSDSQCHFFLLLLQLLQRDDLIAQLGEIGRLRGAFASEVDFTFLEKALLVTKRHAGSLASDFQPDLAKACADETHNSTLYECRLGKRNFHDAAIGPVQLMGLMRQMGLINFSQVTYSSDPANLASTLKSSSVVVSPVTFAPLAISLRSRRMILPLRVFGSASAKRTSSGFAIAPICVPTCLRNSSFSPRLASTPVFKVTNATTPWPFNSSGLPTTAASATLGWLTSALSISDVPSLWPATFKTSSMRPTIQK